MFHCSCLPRCAKKVRKVVSRTPVIRKRCFKVKTGNLPSKVEKSNIIKIDQGLNEYKDFIISFSLFMEVKRAQKHDIYISWDSKRNCLTLDNLSSQYVICCTVNFIGIFG